MSTEETAAPQVAQLQSTYNFSVQPHLIQQPFSVTSWLLEG